MSCNTSTVSNFSFYTLQSELETDPGHGETNPDTSISRNMSKDSKRKAPQLKKKHIHRWYSKHLHLLGKLNRENYQGNYSCLSTKLLINTEKKIRLARRTSTFLTQFKKARVICV